MKKTLAITLALATVFCSCNNSEKNFDASGAFEAEEILISSEATGTLKRFDLQEGQTLTAGQYIGYIDSVQLYLKKKQLQLQINALLSKKPNVATQLASLQEQLKAAENEQKRVSNLVKADAATSKQLDDANVQITLLKKQVEAQQSTLNISSEGINKDVLPFQVQIEQLNDQLQKCKIISPINGTVLTKYAEANEMTMPGKPLYKIANLSQLILHAYISSNQLAKIKLHQKVKVLTDDVEGKYKETEGTVTWINDKAEFTPKTIQTKDERTNLVYGVKVAVKNDGAFKIGMYAEVKF